MATSPPSRSPYFQSARFRDQDELSALIQGGNSEFIQRGRGAFTGEFTYLGLDHGMVQFGEMSLPYLAKGASQNDCFGVLVHLSLQGDWIWRGQPLSHRSIIAMAPRSEIQNLIPANASWAFLSIDYEPLERALVALHGSEEPLFAEGSRLLLPRPEYFEALTTRLRAVQVAVRADPSLLEVPEARRGVEESVIAALARALGSAARLRQDHRVSTRARVARSIEDYLESAKGETLSLADLCAVSGVSERTLRDVFQEHYGMSPLRYLRTRRLHHVKRALRRANPDLHTVQSVAHRHGIGHMGRFAAEYRTLFSESPVETLRKTGPGDRHASTSTRMPVRGRRVVAAVRRPN